MNQMPKAETISASCARSAQRLIGYLGEHGICTFIVPLPFCQDTNKHQILKSERRTPSHSKNARKEKFTVLG